MRLMCHFFGLREKDMPESIFEQIIAVAPDALMTSAKGHRRFEGSLSVLDKRYQCVSEALAKGGLVPTKHSCIPVPGKTYNTRIRRVYDQEDLESSPAVVCRLGRYWPDRLEFGFPKRDEPIDMPRKLIRGSPSIEPIEGEFSFAGTFAHRVLCTERIRASLTPMGYRGLEFRDVKLCVTRKGKRHYLDWDEHKGQRWWEMSSPLRMPPMSPSMHLVARLGDQGLVRVPPGREGFWRADDPEHITPAEFHYLRKDFESMGEFDVAETAEGGSEREYRALICSVRLYKHLVAEGYDYGFTPVRLDDE